ncbi:MAG: hypothetical protein O3B76_07605 [Proteobacteria bacterium]|nr:hypothetical protein [Pseudomonadota bacterium]MDA1022186.1 hypothetical protein [Pseudomonadota bacterium]
MTPTGGQTGIVFVQTILLWSGVLMGAVSAGLWIADTGPVPKIKGLRRWLASSWVRLSITGWREIPKFMNGWLAGKLQTLIRFGFQDADQGVAFGGLIFALLFVFVPVAAAINFLFGGSPFLFFYYLSILGVLGLLNFAGEWEQAKIFSGLAATYLGISLFLIIPLYVLHSFTEVTIRNVFSHAVLKSVLVAAFWYLAAYGIGLMIDTALRFRGKNPGHVPWARFAHVFLAALPVAYVLTFMALLAGHLAVGDQSPLRTWQIILSSSFLTALSLPVTLSIMILSAARKIPGEKGSGLGGTWAFGLSLMAAAILSVLLGYGMHAGTERAVSWQGAVNILLGLKADGGGAYLGPDFWVMRLPFLPLAGFCFIAVFGFICKIAIPVIRKVAGKGILLHRPFLCSALACGVLGILLAGGGMLLGPS